MNREMRRLAEREERRKGGRDERGRRSPTAGSGAPAGEKQNMFKRLIGFLREVRVELMRVAWPSRKQMVAFTTVTLITSAALTGFVFLLDIAFGRVVITFIRTLT